jgi:hypothetical protein
MKRIVTHLENLYLWMPIIKDIYQTFEDAGYSQDEIIARLKKKKFDKEVVAGIKDETYYKIASDLRSMDESRGSWVNEDPNWRDLARQLQQSEPDYNPRVAARLAMSSVTEDTVCEESSSVWSSLAPCRSSSIPNFKFCPLFAGC